MSGSEAMVSAASLRAEIADQLERRSIPGAGPAPVDERTNLMG
jgi:hypothetical protein